MEWLGALLAKLLDLVTLGWRSRKLHRAELHQIRVDVQRCGDAARVLRDDKPMAPASQLPAKAWKQSGQGLHGSGALTNPQYDALHAFFERVEDINISLEDAREAFAEIHTNRSAALRIARVWEKARRLIETYENRNLYDDAMAAVAAAMSRLA
jgi:hypothetical protein